MWVERRIEAGAGRIALWLSTVRGRCVSYGAEERAAGCWRLLREAYPLWGLGRGALVRTRAQAGERRGDRERAQGTEAYGSKPARHASVGTAAGAEVPRKREPPGVRLP